MKHAAEGMLEFFLILFHFPINLLNFLIPAQQVRNPSGTVVILVQRWFSRNPLHILLKIYLEKKGYRVYWVNFFMLQKSFAESALDLKKFIETHNLSSVVLVGISGGGLTCYEYLQNLDGWQRARLFISIGTPFRGAQRAFLMPFKRAREEFSPKGSYIASVLSKPIQNSDKIYCLGAKYDEMVGSANSFLAGTHHYVIDVAGHNILHNFWIPTFKQVSTIIASV